MSTLDLVCDEHHEAFDLIFMDIEGSEIFALRGMTEVLRRTNALIIEFIPHHINSVAGCSIDDFINPLKSNFEFCYVPSLNTNLRSSEFDDFFKSMYLMDKVDDGLIFSKKYYDFN